MKKCSQCGEEKDFSQFHRSSTYVGGNHVMSQCRECHKKWCAKYRIENRERLRKYGREYYRRSRTNPELLIKEKARYRVRKAIESGTLKRMPCEVCGENKVEAHHSDYLKPLEVKWLCKKHHMQTHWT